MRYIAEYLELTSVMVYSKSCNQHKILDSTESVQEKVFIEVLQSCKIVPKGVSVVCPIPMRRD